VIYPVGVFQVLDSFPFWRNRILGPGPTLRLKDAFRSSFSSGTIPSLPLGLVVVGVGAPV
jgi:hypothetical protein